MSHADTCLFVMAISPATAARRTALHIPVKTALQKGYKFLAGVDEAGAGALAGPVVAAAVQLRPHVTQLNFPFLDDSKRLSPKRRAEVYSHLINSDVSDCFVHISPPSYIDEVNILNARLEAMSIAVNALPHPSGLVFVDGNLSLPNLDMEQQLEVGGDAKVSLIAAASILAKVVRDRIMTQHQRAYPQFAFAKHFGYGTKQHLEELQLHGPCPIHRWSYRPVREAAK